MNCWRCVCGVCEAGGGGVCVCVCVWGGGGGDSEKLALDKAFLSTKKSINVCFISPQKTHAVCTH